jgi:hypothetical protein
MTPGRFGISDSSFSSMEPVSDSWRFAESTFSSISSRFILSYTLFAPGSQVWQSEKKGLLPEAEALPLIQVTDQ